MKKTIKIIDLLNKIANGEEVPKKFMYKNDIWEHYKELKDYTRAGKPNTFFTMYYIHHILNDEVEIIEEDKKIEKLTFNDTDVCCVDGLMKQSLNIKKTINEIIDVINELKKGE